MQVRLRLTLVVQLLAPAASDRPHGAARRQGAQRRVQNMSETKLRIVDPLASHARPPLLLLELEPTGAAGFHRVAALDGPVDPQVVAGGAEARHERGLPLWPPIRRQAVELTSVKRCGG